MKTIKANKTNPEKYVLVSREFGEPIYIGELGDNLQIMPAMELEKAQIWSFADTLRSGVIEMHNWASGLKLSWEKI